MIGARGETTIVQPPEEPFPSAPAKDTTANPRTRTEREGAVLTWTKTFTAALAALPELQPATG
jgi:hypothetical protein